MSIIGMNLDFELQFEVTSEPNWLSDRGTASITVGKCDIFLGLVPRAGPDGIFQVDFTRAEINLVDY